MGNQGFEPAAEDVATFPKGGQWLVQLQIGYQVFILNKQTRSRGVQDLSMQMATSLPVLNDSFVQFEMKRQLFSPAADAEPDDQAESWNRVPRREKHKTQTSVRQ